MRDIIIYNLNTLKTSKNISEVEVKNISEGEITKTNKMRSGIILALKLIR